MRPWTVVLLLVIVFATPIASGTGAADTQEIVTVTVAVETPEGEPIRNVNVTASWTGGTASERTAANGQALVDVPAGADVTITTDHPEYIRNDQVTVSDASDRTVSVTMYPPTSVRLVVEDAGGPVSNASVRFSKAGEVASTLRTDGAGVVDTGPLEAGSYSIAITRSGYVDERLNVTLDGEVSRTIRISRRSAVTFSVLDDHFTPPVPVANVSITAANIGSVATDMNGDGELIVPANRSLTVTATKPGYQPVDRTLTITEREERVNLTTRREPRLSVALLNDKVVVGQQVRVDVSDEYNASVSGAEVLVDGQQAGETDANGTARVHLDSEGEHVIEARTDDRTSGTHTVEGIPDRSFRETSDETTAVSTTSGTGTAVADTPAATGNGPFSLQPFSLGLGVLLGSLVVALGAVAWRRVNNHRTPVSDRQP